MPKLSYIDCEYYLFAIDGARLVSDQGVYTGQPQLDPEILREKRLDPVGYGTALFDYLFPAGDPLLDGYKKCLATAKALESKVRFRLHLGHDLPREIRSLRWEYLYDPEEGAHLARWLAVIFSRFAASTVRPFRGKPRMLVAIADPADAKQLGLASIRRRRMEQEIDEILKPLARRRYLSYEIFEGAVTPDRLSRRLDEGHFQLLHLVAHAGVPFRQEARLVLQDPSGLAQILDEKHVSEVFLDRRHLRLVTLLACEGDQPSSDEPWSGLAGRLVQRSLPAVVSMGRRISFDFATDFSRYFYGYLFPNGCVDLAINEARRELSLADPQSWAWSSPVLYMRLADGRLWQRRFIPSVMQIASVVGIVAAGFLTSFGWPEPKKPAVLDADSAIPPAAGSPRFDEPLSRELRIEIEKAAGFLELGGEASQRASVEMYRHVLVQLPPRYYEALNKDRLRKAQDNFESESYRLAAEQYRSLLEDLLILGSGS